jgi:hypothetical protein
MQVIFALVLLVCAGLTIQGFMRLANVYADFQPESVMEFEPILPASSYTDATKISNFYQQLLRDTAALPGVTAAALISNPPASNIDTTARQVSPSKGVRRHGPARRSRPICKSRRPNISVPCEYL